jgi:DNA-binding transcriptional LysR family regulator
MDLRQLRQFVVVAEELSFRRAAERLHISQPPLSATIRRLEEHLAVRLFERDRHRVTLTASGVVLLEEARRLLSDVGNVMELTRKAAEGSHGVLRVSCVPSALLDLLPEALREFHRLYPLVRVVVTRELSSKQLESVAQSKVDVAILIPTPTRQFEELRLLPLKVERLMLACPCDHRLAGGSAVNVRDIHPDPVISFFSLAESPGYAGALMKAFESSGFQPQLVHDYSQWGTSLVMVAAGFGLAIVPRSMGALQIKGIAYVELVHESGAPIEYPIAVATSAHHRNPVIDNFLRVVGDLYSAS